MDAASSAPALPGGAGPTRFETWAVWLFAGAVWVGIVLLSCFQQRQPSYDEIGLHNPIYIYQHYGRWAYPAHGHPDAMVVHPPLHYTAVGFLARLGLPLFNAAGLLLALFATLALVLILRGSYPPALQLSLIAALFFAVYTWNWTLTVRPEMHLALAGACGLLALDRARSGGWKTGATLLGGFLIAYASGIHYIGMGLGVGGLVYAGLALRDQGWRRGRRTLLVLAAGAALFAVPYALLWVIPNRAAIRAMTRAVQDGGGGTWDGLRHYLKAYAFWKTLLPTDLATRPFATRLVEPFIALGVPLSAALVGLLAWRRTRALALAGLPHVLFVMLYVRGGLKVLYGYRGYYVLEFFFGFLAVLVFGLLLLQLLAGRLGTRWRAAVVPAAAVALLLGTAWDWQRSGYRLAWSLNDLDVARAAGNEIVGEDGCTGVTNAAVWYTAGGSHVYFYYSDLMGNVDLSPDQVKAYGSNFDALIVHPFMAATVFNKSRKNGASYYADGTLRLRGYYFGVDGRPGNAVEPWLGYLALHPDPPAPPVGFGYLNGHLYRFEPSSQGGLVFAAYTGPAAGLELPNRNDLDYFMSVDLPAAQRDGKPTEKLYTFLMPRADYDRLKPGLCARYHLHEDFPVEGREVDVGAFLARYRERDKPIEFPRNVGEVEAAHRHHHPDASAGLVPAKP
jgi:hypothetical protein